MLNNPFIRLAVVSSVAFALACDDGTPEGGLDPATGNTVVELLVTDPDQPLEDLAMLVDFVSYRIVCGASGLTPQDDSVDLTGSLEVVSGPNPLILGLVTDLPPGPCSMSMWVFYDDEVVCSHAGSMMIVQGETNQYSFAMMCTLSVDPPSGDLLLGATFDTRTGNYCPQLIWLSAVPSTIPIGASAAVEVYAYDEDGTCGLGCDPTEPCDFSSLIPVCNPGPDPGLSTTLFTDTGAGTFDDPNASTTNFNCDPAAPGSHQVCVRASDGDEDCDQERCTTVVCP